MRHRWAWPLAILTGAFALRLVPYTGIQGNDDVSYYAGAWRISHGVTLPKDDLLQTRFAYVAPVAALFGLFGTRISCLIFPSLLASLMLIALAHWLGRERYSERVGRVAALFVALFPLDEFYATTSNTDVPLAAWLGLGTCLAWSAPKASSPRLRIARAIAAGLSFGMAHLTKESAVLLLLPLSLFPYRPVLHFQARMYSVLILPGAVLAAAWLVEAVGSRRPKIAWGLAAVVSAVALLGSLRLHADGVAWRSGPEWAHEILKSTHAGSVLTDPRSGQMLVMLSGTETFYRVHRYQTSNLPPPPGTLLLQIDRLATASQDWDRIRPPAWWKEGTLRREVVAEQRRPGPWRLRGARGPDEVATLYRVLPP